MLLCLLMLREGFGNDESIIQVDKDKVTEEVPEDIFNYAVEQYWCVGKSEKHHKIPRVPQVSVERCFGFISLFICTRW